MILKIIRFDEEFINYTNETIKNYSTIIIILAGATGLMLILIFALIRRLQKSKNRIKKFVDKQEAKIEATRKLNDVVAEVKKITEEEKKKTTNAKGNKKKNPKDSKKEEGKREKETDVKVTEIKSDGKKITEVSEDSEEMYDLFEDEKKNKKKKKK